MEKKIQDYLRKCYLVANFNNMGKIQDCGNYRVVKTISHRMKILGEISGEKVEGRKRGVVKPVCFFLIGKSTKEPIFFVWQFIEKKIQSRKTKQRRRDSFCRSENILFNSKRGIFGASEKNRDYCEVLPE